MMDDMIIPEFERIQRNMATVYLDKYVEQLVVIEVKPWKCSRVKVGELKIVHRRNQHCLISSIYKFITRHYPLLDAAE